MTIATLPNNGKESKPQLLDLFSGAGGCSRGYQMAGFYVVGVDIEPQKNYIGDDFIQMDALEVLRILIGGGYIVGRTGRRWYLSDFTVIHASPPCEFGSEATPLASRGNHKNYIPDTRHLLQVAGKPYVIENVENVRGWLENPVMLCGSMFGLEVWRHRYFEIFPFWFMSPAGCRHDYNPVTIHSGSHTSKLGRRTLVDDTRRAMCTDWMTRDEVYKAIPPAYTHWIGKRLLEMLALKETAQ